jgi:arylsulfatase A-like enzyme
LTRRNAGAKSYSDSIALADVFLGDIRTAMTRVGLWDTTTVLVSSDHANRVAKLFDGKEDPRVPFLLKLAGQTSAVTYTAPLQTVVSKALLETILARQVNTPEEAVSWLQTHSPTSSSPSAQ